MKARKAMTAPKMRRAASTLSILALAAGIGLGPAGIDAQAKEAYTYTVTFYAGNQGSFTGQTGLSVQGGAGKVDVGKDKITVSELPAGAIVTFDPQAGAISLGDNQKYYIRGVRGSGRDNSTVSASAFRVTGDADYVAAYGIKGEQVKYTVYFQDQAGNQLADPEERYGNIGDRPVVAYKYINADWTPQVLALTGTLSANEAENVFVFVYEPTATAPAPAPAPTPAPTPTPTATPTTTTPTPTPTTAPAAPVEPEPVTTPEPGEPGDIISPDPTVPTTNPGENGDENSQDPIDVGSIDAPDDQVPQSNTQLVKKLEKGYPLLMYGGIGMLAAAAFATIAFLVRKRLIPLKGRKGAADGGEGTDKKEK